MKATGVAKLQVPKDASPEGKRSGASAEGCAVTVSLLHGGVKTGHLLRFSPSDVDLPIELTGTRALRVVLAAEQVAYVAFHRKGNAAPRVGSDQGPRRILVYGGAPVMVRASDADLASKVGFFATPMDPTSKFREIFFYRHGVRGIEDADPIGQMLVHDGHLTQQELELGLAEQEEQRNVPIGQLLIERRSVPPASINSALALQARRRKRLGEILVEEGAARQEDIDAALAEQKKRSGKRLGEVLVEMGLITETLLTSTLARKFHLPFVDLDRCALNPAAVAEVDWEMIESHALLPLDTTEHTLTVAIPDPQGVDVLDRLRILVNKKQIVEVVATPSQIRAHVEQIVAEQADRPRPEVDQILSELTTDEQSPEHVEAAEVQEGDHAVIKLVYHIIADAYRAGASDIHIEPNGSEDDAKIRFRVDGECLRYRDIPPAFRRSLVTRLKVMAKLDIAERRKPQDGKIRVRLWDKHIELRLATLPTVGDNEDVVLRILAASTPLPLEQMAFCPRNLARLRELIAKPYGLILCVGPTGSGKTTTLHSMLGVLNTVDTKIWTAEDPVEITQPGLRQVQVNPKIGLTFASTLRAFLRADPDVIMVGEMRDAETASIAVEASLTGHLVLSTLHTNSAPETLTRLLDMGLDPFSFGDALLGVLAQRLLRKICRACRRSYVASSEELDELFGQLGAERAEQRGLRPDGEVRLYRGEGCSACDQTGYKGRLAVHELLVSNGAVRRLIARRAPVSDVRRAAMKAGMSTLVQDGIDKALAGEVDLRQVMTLACIQDEE